MRPISNILQAYSRSTRLAAVALVSGLIYLFVFTLPFPLARFYNTVPPVDYTKLTNYSRGGLFAYIFGLAVLFGLYIWAIRLYAPAVRNGSETSAYKPDPRPARIDDSTPAAIHSIFVSSTTFAFILIFSYPITAIDLFVYAIHTRGWSLYNLLPSATPPEALPSSDPWLELAGEWVNNASPYGPVWEWLSLGAFHLSGGEFLSHLFALKVLGGLAYLGCIWLVYRVLRQIRPDWATAGTIAFAWNPLVLFESVQNAHNDIVMVFFLVAAVWAFAWGSRQNSPTGEINDLLKDMLVCLFLTLSILVKFVTILVVPFFIIALVMRRSSWLSRITAGGLYSLIIAGLVVILMLPIWPGWDNWSVLKIGGQAGRSLLALLVLGLRNSLGTNPAFDVARNVILVIFGLIYLYFLGKALTNLYRFRPVDHVSSPQPSPIVLAIFPAFFVLFLYVLLAAPVFHAWYLLWFLPLAPFLLPQQRSLVAAIIFSITALTVIPYFETIRVWYPFLIRNHFVGHLIGVPLLILPPLLSLLWSISLSPNSEVSSSEA